MRLSNSMHHIYIIISPTLIGNYEDEIKFSSAVVLFVLNSITLVLVSYVIRVHTVGMIIVNIYGYHTVIYIYRYV